MSAFDRHRRRKGFPYELENAHNIIIIFFEIYRFQFYKFSNAFVYNTLRLKLYIEDP